MTNTHHSTNKASPERARLLIEERRRLIVKYVEEDGRATVQNLAERLGASAVTVRNDLTALAHVGALTRTYGGAVPIAPNVTHVVTSPTISQTRHIAEKCRIGVAAGKLVEDGETIILASGSTTMEVARQIHRRSWQELTIITNSLNIALELNDLSGVRVMVLGGMLRPATRTLLGSGAERALDELSADRLFLGADGLDPQVGITTRDTNEGRLNKLMVRVSRETIAVLDSSKLGQRALSVIVPVEHLDVIVTDTNAPHDALTVLKDRGLRVVLA